MSVQFHMVRRSRGWADDLLRGKVQHRLLQRSEFMHRAPGGIDVQIGGLRVRNDDVPKLQQLAPHDAGEGKISPTSVT
jgi:hypothetical protein